MKNQSVQAFLANRKINYSVLRHPIAYRALEVAASAHIPSRQMAKTVVVEMDGRAALAVLSSNCKIILQDLRVLTGTDKVKLAPERTFRTRFPDCETGAMPPLGPLYGMDVFVAPGLAQNKEIAFNAGSHEELIKMSYKDFVRTTHPKVVDFT